MPLDADARVLLIEGAAGAELSWRLETVFGAPDGASVRCRSEDGVFSCENPEAYLHDAVFHACASVPASVRCDFRQPGMLMKLKTEGCIVLACGCCSLETLKALCSADAARAALGKVTDYWQKLLGRLKIHTSVTALDNYVNQWCAYQCIACRLMGRSSLYQSGGAIGFRDQLQDGINMLLLSQKFARVRILDCCRHQYEEGDVMHWWHPHPNGDKGVRTRCSDDLLWLVWALCEYVEATGDRGLCNVQTHYILSPPLSDTERDRYETPEISPRSASVLEHAAAALEQALSRPFGAHGLPLFGSGDWNDALDEVDGESVWLAQAALRAGLNAEGWQMLLSLLPEGKDMAVYAAEPYVLPADVSFAQGHKGEAGWTWYTGSAGWFFTAVVSSLLGLALKGGELTVSSEMPPFLQDFTVEYTAEDGKITVIEGKNGHVSVREDKNSRKQQ